MFKRRVNEAVINFSIEPVTPLLVKASEAGADPAKPDMEFVETYHNGRRTVYIPGSSLKGAIRSHAERLVRTLGGSQPDKGLWACDPLNSRVCHDSKKKDGDETVPQIYKRLCFCCRIFGSMQIGSHCTFSDAYPDPEVEVITEERNGIAIDRLNGSVARGALFNYQVVTQARFKGTVRLSNFSLDQLALLALVLRDIDQHSVSLGFSKSRGFGQVTMKVDAVTLGYPGCFIDDQISVPSTGKKYPANTVLGAGALFPEAAEYGYPTSDTVEVRQPANQDELSLRVVHVLDAEHSDELWKAAVGRWKQTVMGAQRR